MTPLRRTGGPLDPAAVEEVRTLAGRATLADGVEPLGEQTLLDLTHPDAVHVAVEDGALVGYGQLGPRHGDARTVELVVAPDSRRRGIGSALLDALLAEARGARDTGEVGLWAHGSLPAARDLAHRRGLVPVRELWRMTRELPGAERQPEQEPIPGVRVRAFVPESDEQAWLAANAAAFAHHPDQGGLTGADLDARMREPWFDAEDLLLAEDAEGVVGFAWTKVTLPSAELYVLGVVPRAQGRGLGGALTRVALAHLERPGAPRAVLSTDADHHGIRRRESS
ncbi:MAG TPA: mycothiol synthase, partial [Actinotalea sp.]|nr:mycothiol synthase [Actinotalea sp.]